MAEDTSGRARELVLAPNEFAYILDLTKGDINLYVGPKKDSLAQSDQPVIFDYKTKRFEYVPIDKAVQTMVIAPEGFYVVLKNPAKDNKHPPSGSRSSMPELETGRKINIPGPCAFATWPAQMSKVLQGHRIRSNQYLLVRVYDEKAAQANWKNTIIKTAAGENAQGAPLNETAENLTMGKLIVICGTDVSFFIPPTGIEVVADQDGKLVRDAVTLERLDYCLLLDENGNKRFERGPAVVFPKPTEIFRTHTSPDNQTTRKFRAIELSETSGIYLKVIADYVDEHGTQIKAGEELFTTGKEEKIYFPREEHAIIKYGEHEVHYATAIPAGEGRYVLNRLTGDVRLVNGPTMFLPDPRIEVICKRVLDAKLCELLYPGNHEALQHNLALQGDAIDPEIGTLERSSKVTRGAVKTSALYAASVATSSMVSNAAADRGLADAVGKGFTGDGFDRLGRYTEPRSITLHTKYSGAVSSDLWTGYAVKLVRKSGDVRVEVGPKTVMLQYDEVPQILKLSTGKPKNADTLRPTVFLQVKANKVSDIIDVESRDFCKMHLKLSYRVNFEGDPKKWFDVENYVKFLTDNMRSRLRAAVAQFGIEDFYRNSVAYIRNVVLGEKKEEGPRDGMLFGENGMRVYDVEVLEVEILDKNVEKVLVSAQREAIGQRLELENQKRKLDFTKANEDVLRQIAEAQAETQFAALKLMQESIKRHLEADLAKIAAVAEQEAKSQAARMEKEKSLSDIAKIALLRTKEQEEQDIELEAQRSAQRLDELKAEVEAVVEKAKAITPDLVAALQAYGDKALIEKLSEAMSPLAILGGTSVTDVVKKLLEGTKLAQYVTTPSNGQAAKLPPSASA